MSINDFIIILIAIFLLIVGIFVYYIISPIDQPDYNIIGNPALHNTTPPMEYHIYYMDNLSDDMTITLPNPTSKIVIHKLPTNHNL